MVHGARTVPWKTKIIVANVRVFHGGFSWRGAGRVRRRDRRETSMQRGGNTGRKIPRSRICKPLSAGPVTLILRDSAVIVGIVKFHARAIHRFT